MPDAQNVKRVSLDFAALGMDAMDALDKKNPLHKKGEYVKVRDSVFYKLAQHYAPRIAGAAALPGPVVITSEDQLEDERFQEMSDQYTSDTRQKFESQVWQVGPVSSGVENRANAFFRKGFHLDLVPVEVEEEKEPEQTMPDTNADSATDMRMTLPMPEMASMQAEDTKPPMSLEALKDKAEKQPLEQDKTAKYRKHLRTLEKWAKGKNVMLKDRMNDSNITSFVQGRALAMMFPAISKLAPGQLPVSVQSIPWEDTANPIVDTQYWTLAGVRVVNMKQKGGEEKEVAMLDEMIYTIRRPWMRKESRYYGSSPMEPILQASRIMKKLIDYDFAKAIVAGYMTKFILEVEIETMTSTERDTRLDDIIAQFVRNGTDVTALEKGITAKTEGVKVDTGMLVAIYGMIQELIIGATRSTKGQMGITEGLTRDNATIQEQIFIKYVRSVDEMLIKTDYENQCLTPLLAHLAGEEVENLPVKVVIVSDDGELDDMGDKAIEEPLQKKKAEELKETEKDGDLKQDDAKDKPFGASGSLHEREVVALERLADVMGANKATK